MGNQGICNDTDDSHYGYKAGESLRSEWGPGMTIDGYTGYQSEGTNWRTMTKDEWGYLFNGRTNHSQKYGLGIVNGVKGMIVLPDDWTLPEGLNFITGTSDWNNEYNIAQWEQMEWNGAVFLPAAGAGGRASAAACPLPGSEAPAPACRRKRGTRLPQDPRPPRPHVFP